MPNPKDIKQELLESLYFEVMEDFLHEAEWAVKCGIRDKEKYYQDLGKHYEKLKSYFSAALDTYRDAVVGEVAKMLEFERSILVGGDGGYYDELFRRMIEQVKNGDLSSPEKFPETLPHEDIRNPAPQ